MTNLTLSIFTDANKAREHLEALHWPDGPICAHCGVVNEATLIKGKSVRPGLYQCNACRKPFSVTVGTVMERSHIPLNKWVLAFHLMASSKKGISAHQMHRMLGITYKSSWFMCHRVREAMGLPADAGPIGGEGEIIEVDETELAPSRKTKRIGKRSRASNKKFVTLVQRGGEVRSRNISKARISTTQEVRKVLKEELHPASTLHSDSAAWYKMPVPAAEHEKVNHNVEFARDGAKGDRVHVNSAEGFFSIFKRGLVGTYQHMSEQHLGRYLAEFDFRASNRESLGVNDTVRTERAIKGARGKRLLYQGPSPV